MRKQIGYVVLIIFFGYLLLGAVLLRPFGDPVFFGMDNYIIQYSQSQAAANNVVTAVLMDWRAFDTLGEVTVLFTAVAGALSALRKQGSKSIWRES